VITWWMVAEAARAACGAVTGARVHLPEGPAVVDVVWVDGRIAAVGPGLPELAKGTFGGKPCAVRDGTGRELTAGLVAVPTQLGVVGIDLEPGTHDDDAEGTDPVRASLRVLDGYDPTSATLAVARREGITAAIVFPGGGTVAGVAGAVHFTGDTQAEAIVDAEVAVVGTIPTGAWGEGLAVWSGLLDDARAHARNPALFDQGRPYADGASRADLEVLAKVARRELPLVVGAQSAWQLEALLRWKAEEQVDLVVTGAAEGWKVAPALAAAKVPVIVDPLVYGAGGFDQLGGRPDNAALLARAGVDVILTTNSTHHARTLRQVAGNAVRGGMDHEAALRAITATPARVFGDPARGVIRVGSPADLVVWTGDPLELSSQAERAWIDGVAVSLRSRQTALFEKYRTLPGTPAPALSLP
jgi:imidazolonepropionase-like amidohydrolase